MKQVERDLRELERHVGSLAYPANPKYSDLTLRERLRIRLIRYYRDGDAGSQITFCHICYHPYIHDVYWSKYPVCSRLCAKKYRDNQRAVGAGIEKYQGQYNRAVDVRLRLGVPVAVCKHCGIPFPPYNIHRKYCSDKCKDAAYWKRRPRRICKECGTRYRGHGKTCSFNCYMRLFNRERINCARCGGAIKGDAVLPNEDTRLPTFKSKKRKAKPIVFCSGRCRDAMGWSPMRKACAECGKGFYPTSREVQRRQRFCGDVCKRRCNDRKKIERQRANRPERVCQNCGEALPADRQYGYPYRYCDMQCRTEADRMRREARRGIPVEWIAPSSIEVGMDMELVGNK